MGVFKDLIGMRFGRLIVQSRAENSPGGNSRLLCKCDCGNTCIVQYGNLTNGHTKSCGCIQKERLVNDNPNKPKHGMSHSLIFNVWSGIKKRCLNPNCKNYPNYGGRGISIYKDWADNFQTFYDYVSKLPHFNEDGYSIDRIDNNGNYEPGNVRWATAKEQARNRSNNTYVEYEGKMMPLIEVSEKSGISYDTLLSRRLAGATDEKLVRPVNRKR